MSKLKFKRLFLSIGLCFSTLAAVSTTAFASESEVEIDKRTVKLALEHNGLYLTTTLGHDPDNPTVLGPFKFQDTIPEPYGLKSKLRGLREEGRNIRGTSAVMLDYSGEEVAYMKRYLDIKGHDAASPGTFFYEGELPENISSDTSLTIMKQGNEGFPQVNFRILEPKHKTTYFDEVAVTQGLEEKIASIKDRSIVKLGKIKPKRGGKTLKVYAVRFATKQSFLKVVEVLDPVFFGKEYSRERLAEITEIVNELKIAPTIPSSYEHYIAFNVEEVEKSRNWVENVSIFTNRKASMWKPATRTVPAR